MAVGAAEEEGWLQEEVWQQREACLNVCMEEENGTQGKRSWSRSMISERMEAEIEQLVK